MAHIRLHVSYGRGKIESSYVGRFSWETERLGCGFGSQGH